MGWQDYRLINMLFRCIYIICWRNRIIIPLIIICASFAMLITLFYHRTLNEHNDEYLPHKHSLTDILGAINGREKRGGLEQEREWLGQHQWDGLQHMQNRDHALPGIHDPGGLMMQHAKRHSHDVLKDLHQLSKQQDNHLLQDSHVENNMLNVGDKLNVIKISNKGSVDLMFQKQAAFDRGLKQKDGFNPNVDNSREMPNIHILDVTRKVDSIDLNKQSFDKVEENKDLKVDQRVILKEKTVNENLGADISMTGTKKPKASDLYHDGSLKTKGRKQHFTKANRTRIYVDERELPRRGDQSLGGDKRVKNTKLKGSDYDRPLQPQPHSAMNNRKKINIQTWKVPKTGANQKHVNQQHKHDNMGTKSAYDHPLHNAKLTYDNVQQNSYDLSVHKAQFKYDNIPQKIVYDDSLGKTREKYSNIQQKSEYDHPLGTRREKNSNVQQKIVYDHPTREKYGNVPHKSAYDHPVGVIREKYGTVGHKSAYNDQLGGNVNIQNTVQDGQNTGQEMRFYRPKYDTNLQNLSPNSQEKGNVRLVKGKRKRRRKTGLGGDGNVKINENEQIFYRPKYENMPKYAETGQVQGQSANRSLQNSNEGGHRKVVQAVKDFLQKTSDKNRKRQVKQDGYVGNTLMKQKQNLNQQKVLKYVARSQNEVIQPDEDMGKAARAVGHFDEAMPRMGHYEKVGQVQQTVGQYKQQQVGNHMDVQNVAQNAYRLNRGDEGVVQFNQSTHRVQQDHHNITKVKDLNELKTMAPPKPPTHDLHGHLSSDNLWDKIVHNRSYAYDVRPDHNNGHDDWKPYHSVKLYRHARDMPDIFSQWLDDSNTYCEENFIGYHNEIAMLKNVVIDMNYATGRKGGEEIKAVINQPEEDEYFQFQYGFMQLPCEIKPDYFFNNNNHNNQWLFAMRTLMAKQQMPVDKVSSQFIIAITRYEYANIYHTMTDFYNAFVVMEFFNKSQTETNILIIDGHPRGALDPTWSVLFNSTQRLGDLPKRTQFKNLVWGMLGYNSHIMDHYAPSLPLIAEFSKFFLSSYGINATHKLNCDNINIVFIWRRDYLAHPRNPSGSISRKIQNEQELVDTLRKNFPKFSIKGIQIDLFDMRQQLEFITKTDIMIGMHGAGLTHGMFLPSHAGVIELLPVYWAAANEHFEAIARWRDLLYLRWVNSDMNNEAANYHTIIPPDILNTMVTSTVEHMCQTGHKDGQKEEYGHHEFGREY